MRKKKMARFDLNSYQDVQARLKALHAEHPDARIVTENLTTPQDRSVSTWVVKASLYLTAGDQAAGLPKATGHAFEIDGGTGANATAALENGETSAIGRCLRIAGIGDGPSRQEMEKANRGVTPKPPRDFLAEAEKMMNVSDLRELYTQAAAAGAPSEVLDRLKDYGKVLGATGEGDGTRASVPGSAKSRQK
jgi:hypothetical protein